MKTIILLLTILLISCQKEQIKPIIQNRFPCAVLPISQFTGNWKWQSVKHPNQDWKIMNADIFQEITITNDSIIMTNIPQISYKWTDLGCSTIQGFSPEWNVVVQINGDVMILSSTLNETQWILSRVYNIGNETEVLVNEF